VSLRLWFFFVVTEAVLCLTPGPAVLFVVSCGLARGGRAALWGNAGILSADTFYFIVSAFGLGAVLLRWRTLLSAGQFFVDDADEGLVRLRP
jgi:homoserine/homoserine lactone efflux protein